MSCKGFQPRRNKEVQFSQSRHIILIQNKILWILKISIFYILHLIIAYKLYSRKFVEYETAAYKKN